MNKFKLKHFSDRKGTVIDTLVVHWLSNKYEDPIEPYNPQRCIELLDRHKVSYHYLVTRPAAVWQLVPESYKAWHAGKSKWKGATNLNSRSIGVAFLGMDGRKFAPVQYEKGIPLLADIVKRRQIVEDRMIGHEHIAPKRRTDPGRYFDWIRVYDEIYRPALKKEEPINIPAQFDSEPRIESSARRLTTGKDSFLELILSFFKRS